MRGWRTLAFAAGLAGAAAVGAAVAPVAYGQDIWSIDEEPQILEFFGGSSRIGVSVKDVTEEEVTRNKLSGMSGALITDVHDDTPAATAGFKTGDVVIEFDGERVRSARQLTRLVQETPTGRAVPTIILRDGQRLTLTVTPQESNRGRALERLRDFGDFGRTDRDERPLPQSPPGRPAPPPRAPRAPLPPEFDDFVFGRSNGRLGISVDDLSDQLAGYFGAKDGVLVTTVRDDSAAAKAGIKAGDVITAFNGSPVTRSSELRRRIQRLDDGGEFTIDLVRDRKTMTVKGKVAAGEERRRTYRSIV